MKNEKRIEILIRISGVILIMTVLTMRISEVTYGILNNEENCYWYHVFPDTFCSFSSLTLGCAAAFGKKNNVVLHFAAMIVNVFFAWLTKHFYNMKTKGASL